MKLVCRLIILLSVALCFAGTCAALAEEKPEAGFNVKGNGNAFRVDKKGKRQTIRLADCVVHTLIVHRTRREVPAEYDNQEAVQRVFDEILAGDVVAVSKKQEQALADGALDPCAYGGLIMVCEPERPTDADAEPVPGYARLKIDPMDEQAGEAFRDVVRISMHVMSRWKQTTSVAYVRSKALYDLVMRMSAQSFALEDLGRATEVAWGGEWNGQINMHTSDAQAIAKLAEAMTAGERLDARIKVQAGAPFYFSMPEGHELAVYIVRPADAPDPVDLEKWWEEKCYLMTGDALYTLDAKAVNDVIHSQGLRGLERLI